MTVCLKKIKLRQFGAILEGAFMERFSVTMNSEDIDLFEQRRAELGLTKSAYIRYLISENENGIPDFIAFKEVIKQMAELNTYMKEFVTNTNFKTSDKLLLFEKIDTLTKQIKRAVADCANLAQSARTNRNKK